MQCFLRIFRSVFRHAEIWRHDKCKCRYSTNCGVSLLSC